MKNYIRFAIAILTTVLLLNACNKDAQINSEDILVTEDVLTKGFPNLPSTPFNYANIQLPNYLSGPNIVGQLNTPANNVITDHGATLGRVLFYDVRLSKNNVKSCSSCHLQANSFSDPDQFSTGFDGGLTDRNSMSLLNAAYYPNGHFFWDERAVSAEVQASGPITNAVEMGMTMPEVVVKLQQAGFYQSLFQKAYGSEVIDSAGIVKAIAQFVRSMVSYRTKYDEGRAAFPPNQNPGQVNFANFTAQENQGKQLFFGQAGCAACHGTETFTSPGARNNGLDLVYADNGVGAVTGNPQQNGLFKSPSLRGIEPSAPYMHDGRFATLEAVVEHYSTGIKAHPNLSPQLRLPNGMPRNLNLTTQQKAALVAFLKRLNDTGIATDAKFANPFF
jgi:cytochrome c peroxidase